MRKDIRAQIDAKNKEVQSALDNALANGTLTVFVLGHAFIWGYVEVKLKNGKSKIYKDCLGYVCASDLRKACKIAESVPGISGCYYNLD